LNAEDPLMSAVAWPLIEVDADGVAYLEGTRTKVIEVALDRLTHHWDADEIRRQHPHLTLGQIHAALAYYYEHEAECDRLIEERFRRAEELCRKHDNPVLRAKLRAAQ
jgi:uncharacterized protein (DUF433 family)